MTRPPTEAASSAGCSLRLLLSSELASLVHSAVIFRKTMRYSRLLIVSRDSQTAFGVSYVFVRIGPQSSPGRQSRRIHSSPMNGIYQT
jgi:hypothetical protein